MSSGFSLHASYAVRIKPQTRGRCHAADYVRDAKVPTILVPDVGRSHAIAVPDEAAALVRAAEDAPARRTRAPMPALWARPGFAHLLTSKLRPNGELTPASSF